MWLLLLLFPAFVWAQTDGKATRQQLEKRKKELQAEIVQANRELLATRKSARQNIGLQRELEQKIAVRNQQINGINGEIRKIDGDINNTSGHISTLEKELDSLKARYAQLIVYAYKSQDNAGLLSFLFAAENFNDALRRFQYLRQYRENRRRAAENLLTTQVVLKDKIDELQALRATRTTALRTEQQQRITLVADKKETDQTIAQLQDKEKLLQDDIRKRKAESRQIDAAIRAAIQREIAAARRKAEAAALARKKAAAARRKKEQEARRRAAIAAGKKVPPKPAPEKEEKEEKLTREESENVLIATPEARALSEHFESNRGRLPWPVEAGRITGHYGHDKVGKVEKDNTGVIIATGNNAAVKAIFDGEVILVYAIKGAGSMVIIRHGRYFTNYVRLGSVSVSKGQQVRTGQVLGTAAANHNGQGEIELQVYRNNVVQNPEGWIRRR